MNEPIVSSSSEFKTACGGKLKSPENFPYATYRGQRIYFCNTACLKAFENDPDPFMNGEIKHPIRKDEV